MKVRNNKNRNGSYRKNRKLLIEKRKEDGSLFCDMCGCPVCDTLPESHPNRLTVDHIKPVSLGGSRGAMFNLRLACFQCNQEKGNGIQRAVF